MPGVSAMGRPDKLDPNAAQVEGLSLVIGTFPQP